MATSGSTETDREAEDARATTSYERQFDEGEGKYIGEP